MDPYAPQQTRRPPWKIIAIIAGAAVIGVAIIVAAVLFVRSRRTVNIDVQNLNRAQAQLEQDVSACAQSANPAACTQEKTLRAAKALGAASLCATLTDAAYDGCVWDVARQTMDASVCAQIHDATRAASCANGLYAQQALAAHDPSLCHRISDPALVQGCMGAAQGPLTAANCAERGESADTCAALTAYEAAVASKNPDSCNALADETNKNLCLEAVGSGDRDLDGLNADDEAQYGTSDTNPDSDGDGLTDGQEVNTYHTNPTNPDTDGDGYSDGNEVKNGYNPNGAGRL